MIKNVLIGLFLFSLATVGYAQSGGKKRLADSDIDEVYQLCQQLGVEEGTTILVEQCANEDNCVVIKVDCALADDN